MSDAAHVIPVDVEAPVPIMFWDPMEFIMAVSMMGFGMVMNLWILGMIGGVGILIGSRYLKRGSKRGAMQHLLWSMGLTLDRPLANKFPPAWDKDFIE